MDIFWLAIIYFLFKLVLPAIFKKKRIQMQQMPRPVFTIPTDDETEERAELPQPQAKAKVYVSTEPQDMGKEGNGENPLLVPSAPLTKVVTNDRQIFTQQQLRNGFIMAEILGKPKALIGPKEGR